jgi:hypothetical protein
VGAVTRQSQTVGLRQAVGVVVVAVVVGVVVVVAEAEAEAVVVVCSPPSVPANVGTREVVVLGWIKSTTERERRASFCRSKVSGDCGLSGSHRGHSGFRGSSTHVHSASAKRPARWRSE